MLGDFLERILAVIVDNLFTVHVDGVVIKGLHFNYYNQIASIFFIIAGPTPRSLLQYENAPLTSHISGTGVLI